MVRTTDEDESELVVTSGVGQVEAGIGQERDSNGFFGMAEMAATVGQGAGAGRDRVVLNIIAADGGEGTIFDLHGILQEI